MEDWFILVSKEYNPTATRLGGSQLTSSCYHGRLSLWWDLLLMLTVNQKEDEDDCSLSDSIIIVCPKQELRSSHLFYMYSGTEKLSQ